MPLDYYHGKDLLHEGCLLKIDPDYSWERISGKIRNKIRQAENLNIRIERVPGTAKNIQDFRTVWFDPNDETLPAKLSPDEVMYLAYLADRLIGGLILTPSSQSVLFMHNLGANEEGKRANVTPLLLWHAVKDLVGSQYHYIDVGVTFRPTLYTFFRNWQTDRYPIIFNPPFIRPDIRLTPFTANDIVPYNSTAEYRVEDFTTLFGQNYTILPRAIHCLKALMKHLGLTSNDNVAVMTTFQTGYLSRCVSGPIEHYCKVTDKIDATTKAVVVVHEFGFPHPDTLKLKETCQAKGIPLIEDCAWSYGSMIDKKHRIGDVGDYAIFSLPKILPMQYGGVLKGVTISDDDNWNNYQLLDYFKREVVFAQITELATSLPEANEKRRENWDYLRDLFARDGFTTFAELPDGVYPGAFLVQLDSFEELFERYTAFGVETGRYYQGKALFLPVHQNLTRPQLDYIYGAFRGKLNLSSNYSRGGKKQ